MRSPDRYLPFSTLIVPARVFTDIQGEEAVDTDCPLQLDSPYFSQSVTQKRFGQVNEALPHLSQVSMMHVRSFEMHFGANEGLIWRDQYSNFYTRLAIKGANLTRPEAFHRDIEPSGFAINGMQESDSIVRILRSTKLLRSQQVGVEAIVRVLEPLALPFQERFLPLKDFKQALFDQAASGRHFTANDLEKLKEHFDTSTILFSIRAMKASERFSDIPNKNQLEDLDYFFERIAPAVNLEEQAKAARDPQYKPHTFDPVSQADREWYLVEFVPGQIGRNYGVLHKLDLLHVFSHNGNVSALGEICDSDSIKGPALGFGDQPNSQEVRLQEAQGVMKHIEAILKGHYEDKREIVPLRNGKSISLSSELDHKTEKAYQNFYQAYIFAREIEFDILPLLPHLNFVFSGMVNNPSEEYLLMRVLAGAESVLGWSYEYNGGPQILLPLFWKLIRRRIESEVLVGSNREDSDYKKVFENALSRAYYEPFADMSLIHFLRNYFTLDFIRKKREELDKVEDRYGLEVRQALVEMAVEREITRHKEMYEGDHIGLEDQAKAIEDEIYLRYRPEAIAV